MFQYHVYLLYQCLIPCSEHLKTVPDLLETLMSEKRLLQAAILLVRSLKIINKPDMLEIGAVSDLRSYLVSQETVSAFYYYQ
jgi:exocyst complex component 4